MTLKLFGQAEQQFFCDLSQDINPIHTDSLYSRRTQMGRPVVHGIHLLLWAANIACQQASAEYHFNSIRAWFLKPLYIGETAECVITSRNASELKINILTADTIIAQINLHIHHATFSTAAAEGVNTPLSSSPLPRELTVDQIKEHKGSLPLISVAQVAESFPHLAKLIGAHCIAAILTTSRLVGMECPGLHSIFSGLTVNLTKTTDIHALRYAVSHYDARFRSAKIVALGGNIAALVETFVRHPPVQQPTMRELAENIKPDLFAGQQALVVGGSRGLGEITAKIIAAGGGAPTLTYLRGKQEAEAIANEIRSWGGQCSILPYDARQSTGQLPAGLQASITHLYYFATCQIFRRKSASYDSNKLNEYLSFYVDGFGRLSQALALAKPGGVKIFYPSSVAVEKPVNGMMEYSMAKAAGETLCDNLRQQLKNLSITVKRLPRVLTDQTASVALAEAKSALEIMLPIVKEMHGST